MNRRAFLASLLSAAGLAADPEKLLWVPGRKLISIPKPTKIGCVLHIRKPQRFVVTPLGCSPGLFNPPFNTAEEWKRYVSKSFEKIPVEYRAYIAS